MAKKGKSVGDAAAKRLNVRVTTEAHERLMIHALKARVSPGDLVTELIEAGCRKWAMPADLTARTGRNDRPESAGNANLNGPPAAPAG
jgi:hypothetical protein